LINKRALRDAVGHAARDHHLEAVLRDDVVDQGRGGCRRRRKRRKRLLYRCELRQPRRAAKDVAGLLAQDGGGLAEPVEGRVQGLTGSATVVGAGAQGGHGVFAQGALEVLEPLGGGGAAAELFEDAGLKTHHHRRRHRPRRQQRPRRPAVDLFRAAQGFGVQLDLRRRHALDTLGVCSAHAFRSFCRCPRRVPPQISVTT
jgi:hypothetical protein